MKVLIIDDDDLIRRIARMGLTKVGGMSVLEASSGQEGARVAADESPDCILLDMVMPDWDGEETLAALQRQPGTGEIPVIFVTAISETCDTQRLVDLGARGVIRKPFNALTLAGEVRSILGAAAGGSVE